MSGTTNVWARRQVVTCMAALADPAHQKRVWIRQELPFEEYYDELNLQIHVLFDDYCILPDPASAIDGVLMPADNLDYLKKLGRILDNMIGRLGDAPDEVYLADPQWPNAVSLAQRCLAAMLLAGGWEHDHSDAGTYAQKRAEGRIPTVALPATRRRVIKAVAALADEAYQRRTWPNTDAEPTTDADRITGSLAVCLRTLADDTHALPDPRSAIGQVLLDGDEIDQLTTLRDALEPLRADPPAPPWHSPHWPAVVAAGLRCLPALVIAGAWIGPDHRPRGRDGTSHE